MIYKMGLWKFLLVIWAATAGTAFVVLSSSALPQLVNSIGKVLPLDAAPLVDQVYHFMRDEPASLDVSVNLYVGEWNEFLFETLVTRDENGEVIPAAAERWEISADGKTWTFYLRKTGKWSDGRPVTAHDFLYTYRRSLSYETANPYAAFYYDIKGTKFYNQNKDADPNNLGVRVVDAYTLEIETEHPAPYLGLILTSPTSMPVPRWQIEKYGSRWTEVGNCISNSSYQLTEWQTGSHMDFTLNPYYDGPLKGYVEKLHRTFRHPSAANLLPYENNEVGFANVQANELARIQRDPVLSSEMVSTPADGTWYIFFNTHEPPFNNMKVRQAIAHVIDRDTISNVILRGAATPAYSMLPSTFDAADNYSYVQRFDPLLARSLLSEAGYSDGRGFPVMEMWLRQANPENRLVAEVIQSMLLEHLGIRITFRSADYPMFTSNMFNWNINLGLVPFFADYRDPKNMLDMIWRPGERGRSRHDYGNKAFGRLLQKADEETDPGKRTEIYRQAERILVSEAGGVFIYHPVTNGLYKPWIKGLKTNKFGGKTFSFTDVYIGQEYLELK
jgi:oligopeptide transport system substrate-binding protein